MSSEHQHQHSPYLGHHYETMEQQFASGKLGMWLFLATEILLFAGLFCAYAIYRSNHPEVFDYAHQFLDKKLGGINTIILITSSFTMAMAVRTAQLGRRQATAIFLGLTLLGGVGFLGIKKVEYEHKWKHGLLWGQRYQDQEAAHGAEEPAAGAPAEAGAEHAAGAAEGVAAETTAGGGAEPAAGAMMNVEAVPAAGHDAGPAAAPGAAAMGAGSTAVVPAATTPGGTVIERSTLPAAATPPEGLAPPAESDAAHSDAPKNVHIFFGIYFLMTGLHGIHVIAGMIAIAWVLVRTLKGHFTTEYSTPVDLTGLYWHLVDLIWIFLFPLLYLIR